MEMVFLRAGWWLIGEKIDDGAGERFSLRCRLFWTGLSESSEHSDRLTEPLDVNLNPNGDKFSLRPCRRCRVGVKSDFDEGELCGPVACASMFSRLRAGEKGFLSLLISELKSTKSFSIDSELMLSLRHGLIGHGRGLEGGLLVVKNEMSSEAVKVIL